MGIMDRTSLKAYFGTRQAKSVRNLIKTARYSTGTTSLKAIQLTQNVPEKKGYFELLGLATYEQRGNIWIMTFNDEVSIVQTFTQRVYECEESIENFSLSSIHSQVKRGTTEEFEEKESMASPQQPTVGEEEKRESYSVREREISRVKVFGKASYVHVATRTNSTFSVRNVVEGTSQLMVKLLVVKGKKGDGDKLVLVYANEEPLTFSNLLFILKHYFESEDSYYPRANGFDGRLMLMKAILEIYSGMPLEKVFRDYQLKNKIEKLHELM